MFSKREQLSILDKRMDVNDIHLPYTTPSSRIKERPDTRLLFTVIEQEEVDPEINCGLGQELVYHVTQNQAHNESRLIRSGDQVHAQRYTVQFQSADEEEKYSHLRELMHTAVPTDEADDDADVIVYDNSDRLLYDMDVYDVGMRMLLQSLE